MTESWESWGIRVFPALASQTEAAADFALHFRASRLAVTVEYQGRAPRFISVYSSSFCTKPGPTGVGRSCDWPAVHVENRLGPFSFLFFFFFFFFLYLFHLPTLNQEIIVRRQRRPRYGVHTRVRR